MDFFLMMEWRHLRHILADSTERQNRHLPELALFFSGLLFQSLSETFLHILLSNICKIKKEEKRLSYIHCARGEKHYEKTNR